MALLFILAVLALVLVAFYKYFTWNFDYWKRHNVPFEPPTVLLGNMNFLLRENMSVHLQRLYKKFEGHDYFGFWIFGAPTLVIRTPEYAREVLVVKFNKFSDRPAECAESDPLGANCLFIVKGTKWTQLRQRLTPVFTKAKIRSILTARTPELIKELTACIDRDYVSKNKPADVKQIYLKYNVEVTAATVFGVRANSMQDKDAPFLKLAMSFVDWSIYRALEFMSVFYFPNMAKLCNFKFFTNENTEYMRSIFRQTIATRESNVEELGQKGKTRDLVDALVQLSKSEDDGPEFSENDILAQAGIFFFGAFETTSTTMSFLTYELAFNQELQELLYEQIKEAHIYKGHTDIDELDKVKLLDMSIKETLRKYPTLPTADRLCNEDCELPDGFVVKRGTRILICTAGFHHDEKYFPEPDRWDPYRFEDEKNMTPYTFMPFSEGRRMCIGAKFAMQNIKWTLAGLMMKYRFEPSKETVLPQDMRLSPYSLLNNSASPLLLRFVHRQS